MGKGRIILLVLAAVMIINGFRNFKDGWMFLILGAVIIFLVFKFPKKQTKNQNTANYDPWDKSKGNSDTDYSNAIFLHMYSRKAAPIGNTPDDYSRYVSYDLGITNPIKKHKELVFYGYFRKATPLEVIDTYKVAELKEMLEAHGVDPKGRKREELLNKIKENINFDDLKLPVMYVVSDKGHALIEQHQDLIKLFRNPYNISYEEYIAAKQKASPYLKFNDLIWFIFNQRELSFAIDNYGAKRNNSLHRGMFLKSENRLVDALYYYIEVLFYDVNESTFEEILPYIKEQIFELKDYYTEEMVHKCYKNVNLPKRIPQNAFIYILNGIFQGE